MTEVFLGLFAAFLYAGHSFFVKFGLQDSDPTSAALVSTFVNCLVLWCLVLILVPLQAVGRGAWTPLLLAGLIAPGLARIFLYTGIEKVGVSITSPVRSTFPFFSILPAVILLKERFTVFVAVATVITAGGVILLSLSSPGKTRAPGQLHWKKRDLAFPFAAAMCYGVSNFFKKLGMNLMDSPLLAAAIVATAALLLFLLLTPVTKRQGPFRMGRGSLTFCSLGGLAASLAQICMYAALKTGDLVIVGPLISTTPLFILLLTFLFLRSSERVTFRMVSGVAAIVIGVVLLKITS
jgi:DME family drug/metabolite transporter